MTAPLKTLPPLLFFSFWMTGTGIPVPGTTQFLQLSEAVSLLWLILHIVPRIGQTPKKDKTSQAILWALSISVSLSVWLSWENTDPLVLGYLAFIVWPCISLLRYTYDSPESLVRSFKYFRVGALVSSAMALLQVLLGSTGPLDFRNNTNFAIGEISGRGFAFQAEASLLAVTLIATVLLDFAVRISPKSAVAEPRRDLTGSRAVLTPLPWPALALLFGGLLATQSTSVVALLPILLATLAWLGHRARIVRLSVRTAFLAALAGVFIVAGILGPLASRIENTSAIGSMEIRAAGALGAITGLADRPMGFGVGNNAAVADYAVSVANRFGWNLFKVPSGVDVLPLSLTFELGVLFAGVLSVLIFRLARKAADFGSADQQAVVVTEFALWALTIASFAGSLIAVGYRGFLFGFLWTALALRR